MIARALALLFVLTCPAVAQDVARMVYLGVEEDPHYEPQPLYTGLSLRDRERPLAAIRLGLRDTRVLGRVLGLTFALDEVIASPETLSEALSEAQTSQPLAILIDLPPENMVEVLSAAGPDDLFINIRDRSGRWRGKDCAPGLLHTLPSQAMLSDALAQYLRARGWTDVLLVHGMTDADADKTAAARQSATKFGLRIVDERAFELTNDPRLRDKSNIALLTGGARYDVVWLIDDLGDFGRYLPFATYAPRPVIGSEGLVPRAWHWTFERYGAPQLNQRFRRQADRDMTSEDWAAWVAVKVVTEAVVQAGSADRAAVHRALRGEDLSVDLYKGVRGNLRDWDGQLRQPILLATPNAVIAVAPIGGFEHQFDTLDTLGADRAESTCRL
ncbi:ABC transporter substrate-binding protein [Tropicimonas aquimaris]|uniref:ABC transporter substrate-binding protein n=1 Tax=Tropicimonas aquimaris TaxID=914152 RepID=A0ABW3IQP7_9RHOB